MRQQSQHTCFDVLGIDQAADYETGKRAYRELSLKYHPDRVSHLGEEFQLLAGQKFKAIGAAWEEFKRLTPPKN